MRYNDLKAAYYDMRNDVFYTVLSRNDGKCSIYKLVGKQWKVLRTGGQGGGTLVCTPIESAVEAEGVLKLYILDNGLPAEKFNYVYGFFPEPDRIILPLKRVRYAR